MTRLGTRPAGDTQLGRLVWLVLSLARGSVPSWQPGVSLAPVMPDSWHGLLLPPWGPVPQPQHGPGQPEKQWFLPGSGCCVRHHLWWQALGAPGTSQCCTVPRARASPRPGAAITHAAQLGCSGEQPGNFPLRFPSKIWSGSACVVSHSLSSQPSFTHGGVRSVLAQSLMCL